MKGSAGVSKVLLNDYKGWIWKLLCTFEAYGMWL